MIEYISNDWHPYYSQAGVLTWIVTTRRWKYALHYWPDKQWSIQRYDKAMTKREPLTPRAYSGLLTRYASDNLLMEIHL